MIDKGKNLVPTTMFLDIPYCKFQDYTQETLFYLLSPTIQYK